LPAKVSGRWFVHCLILFAGTFSDQSFGRLITDQKEIDKRRAMLCEFFIWSRSVVERGMKMASVTLNRIDENRITAGLSRANLALVCGVKPSTLAAAHNGIVNLGGHREAELLTVSFRLVELREACKPFALPSDANMVRQLVERVMGGEVTMEQIRERISSLFEVTQ